MKKMKYLLLILSLLMTSCGGGGSKLDVNYNSKKSKTYATAKLGRLADARVEIYEVKNNGERILKWTEKTSDEKKLEETGKFNAHLNELNPNKVYIYKVMGGKNWDANEDGVKDDHPTVNKGLIRAIATGRDFQSAGEYLTITVVSEMLYESVAKHFVYYNSERLDKELVANVKKFVKDLNHDGRIDKKDMLLFDPVTDKEYLASLYKYKLPKIIEDVHQSQTILMNIDSIFGGIDLSGYEYCDIALSENKMLAYLIYSNGLKIINVKDPQYPVQLASFDIGGYAKRIVLSKDGNRVFIADAIKGLVVVNVTNTTNLFIESALQFDFDNMEFVTGLALSENQKKVYLTGSKGLTIVDIQNLHYPVKLATIDTGDYANDIVLSKDGTRAYIADSLHGVIVINVTDPENPFKEGIAKIGSTDKIILSKDGKKVFIIDKFNSFTIINVENPKQPFQVGSVKIDYAEGVALSEDETRAYVINNNGLVVINIENSLEPTILGVIKTKRNGKNILLSKSTKKAYIVHENGLIILEPLDPVNPYIICTIDNIFATDIKLSQDETKAFIAAQKDGVIIADVSDPLQPRVLNRKKINTDSYFGDDNINEVKLSQDEKQIYFYGTFTDKLYIADIEDPYNIRILGYINGVSGFEISQDMIKAYILGLSYFSIWNIEDPVNPIRLGILKRKQSLYSDNVTLSKIDEKKVYICDEKVFKIIDVSDFANPVIISSLKLDGYSTDIVLSQDESKAFILLGKRIAVIDIKNALKPSILNYIALSESGQKIVVSKNEQMLYVTEGGNGLAIINIQDLFHPKEIALIDTAGIADGIALSSDETKVYVANGFNVAIIGLDIFEQ